MGTLTVKENLSFSAALRLPSTISQREKEQKVDKLIQELGLTRVANSKVRRTKRADLAGDKNTDLIKRRVGGKEKTSVM